MDQVSVDYVADLAWETQEGERRGGHIVAC
jgi:hypothetical protein